jgi:AcrR family transcriptional regulator
LRQQKLLRHTSGLVSREPASLSSDEVILLAALLCFVEKGYHGATTREIAQRAGLSVPGVYHHFASKQVLLEKLIDDTMDDLIELTERALDAAQPNPVERFDAVVVAHVMFHTDRPEESFIGNSELRSLAPAALERIVGKRDRQQRIFDRVVGEGIEAGAFDTRWPRETSRAVVTMCTAVANWYRRDGSRSADEIVEIYRQIARQTVGCPAGAAPRGIRATARR